MYFVMRAPLLQPVAVSSLFRMRRSDSLAPRSKLPHLNMHEQFPSGNWLPWLWVLTLVQPWEKFSARISHPSHHTTGLTPPFVSIGYSVPSSFQSSFAIGRQRSWGSLTPLAGPMSVQQTNPQTIPQTYSLAGAVEMSSYNQHSGKEGLHG